MFSCVNEFPVNFWAIPKLLNGQAEKNYSVHWEGLNR